MIEPGNTEDYCGTKKRHDAWIVEAIWGHRFELQPSAATLLEFLGIAEGMFREQKLLNPTRPGENHEYTAYRCMELRNILFNNPRMEEIQRNSQGNDDEAWRKWLDDMRDTAALGSGKKADFKYLRDRFDSFGDLVSVVKLLRRITMEPGTDRGWTTQFIFPVGPAALYEALGEKGDGFERNRVVFTRTGELAYLMLSRASEPLRDRIRELLAPSFSPTSPRNRLLMRIISQEIPDMGDSKGGSYLPYKQHPVYDRFAQDVLALLSLKLPEQDAFQHLQPLIAFHLYLYGLETAHHWLGKPSLPPIVCEVLAPRSDLVRRAAVASYTDNDALGNLAVRRFLDTRVLNDAELEAQLQSDDLDEHAKADLLGEHLFKTCALNREKVQAPTHQELKQKFLRLADDLYRDGPALGLRGLARNCGLASDRGTTRYRYAPTDDLLRILVLVNVIQPMEEAEFLRHLHKRYHIAIGPLEARQDLIAYQFDETDFKKNRDRLTQHLVGIGLARRMSDACAYVINPMAAHA